ncbi:MAG: hypothetical protein WCJ86_03890, partial [Candidatus Saccharibacteria bacterium]
MKKIILVLGVTLVIVLTGVYFVVNRSPSTQTYTSPSSAVITTVGTPQINTATVMKEVKWGNDMQISFTGGLVRIQANGIPNHKRDSQYAVPNNQ